MDVTVTQGHAKSAEVGAKAQKSLEDLVGTRFKGWLKGLISGGAVIALISGAAVTTYLKQIDRLDLMQAALSSKEAFGLIFSIAGFFSLLYAVCAFFSAAITYVALDIYDSADQIPPAFAWLVPGAGVAWMLAIGSSFAGSTNDVESTSSRIGPFLIAGAVIVICPLIAMFVQLVRGATFSHPKLKSVLFGFMAAVAPALSIAFLRVLIGLNPSIGKMHLGPEASLIAAAAAVPGILVSSALAFAYVGAQSMRKALIVAFGVAAAVILMASVMVPRRTIYAVAMKSLQVAGVFSTDKNAFLILDEEKAVLATTAGFDLVSTDPTVIRGVERFHLAGRLVLCTEPLDVVEVPLKKDEKEDRSSGCADFQDDEIRRVGLPRTTHEPHR